MIETPIAEQRLADVLGVKVACLRSARKARLERGVDWDLSDRRVVYAAKAIPALLEVLGLADKTPPLDELTRASADPPAPDMVELIYDEAACRNWRNPHLLAGRTTEGAVCRVEVRERVNFRDGMILPCQHVEADLYRLARPGPRWPGRW